MQEYLDSLAEDMSKCIEAFRKDLGSVRTGRASPQILDSVTVVVQSYGATLPINQLATVTAPDSRLLVVNPWDKNTIGDIDRAIASAGLGLNPSSDGSILRVPIPALTGERRQELVKAVKRFAEEARVRVRHVRRDYNEIFKDLEKDGEISEDDLDRALVLVQKSTDEHIAKVDAMAVAKEKDVLES
jgi:ribosome recycling factor